MRNRFAAAFVGLIYFLALNFCATDSGCSALVIYRRKPKPKLVCHEEYDEEELTGSGSGSAAVLSSEGEEDAPVALSDDAEHQHHLTTSKSITTKRIRNNNSSKSSMGRKRRSTENGPRSVQLFLQPATSTATGLHDADNSTPVVSSVSSTMATFLVLGNGSGGGSEGKPSPGKTRQSVAGQPHGRVAPSQMEPIIRIGPLEDIPPSDASKLKTIKAEDDPTHIEENDDDEEEEEATFEIVGKHLTDDEKRSIRRKLTETCRALNLL